MLPDEFPFSGQALQNWLRTSGQQIFTQFETGAEALEYLRSQGAAIRDSTFYDIRREVLGLQLYQEQLGRISEDNLLPAAYHVENHGLNLSEDFLYRVKVDGFDPMTNEPVTKYFAISSDHQMTPGEVVDNLSTMIEGESVFYEVQPEEYTVTSALARPGVFG